MNTDRLTEDVVANLLCYLVDKHENEPLSEDTLQQIGVKFLADEQYKVVVNHTDPVQELTGVALKYRQRARVAEEAARKSLRLNQITYKALVDITKCEAAQYACIADMESDLKWIASEAINKHNKEIK